MLMLRPCCRVALSLVAAVALTTELCAAAPDLGTLRTQLAAGKEPVRIVAFGDSITGLYYHTGGQRAWCDLLGNALAQVFPAARLEMINAGVSGNTSGAGLARIERDVVARRPQLVVVMFGMNDAARAPREQFVTNLKTIVARCRAAGAAVVLCTPNSVYPNPQRPIERLADFAQAVREVAGELEVPLADCYRAYEERRASNPLAWKLLMSETIHPSLRGHRLFAEVMATTIVGQPVKLEKMSPPRDPLHFTKSRLGAGQPVSILAMPPYDKCVSEALKRRYPEARLEVTPWPVEGRSLAQIEQAAKAIRAKPPHLVVIAVPGSAAAPDEESYVRSYAWVLNWSIHFASPAWDRMVLLPSVTGPLSAAQQRMETLALAVTEGADAACILRPRGDSRPAGELASEFIAQHDVPRYDSYKIEGNEIRIAFGDVRGGLVVGAGARELTGFEISAADGQYQPARARIDGQTVLVWNEAVLQPVGVRHGWAKDRPTNLMTRDGHAAPPFHTAGLPRGW